jgi:hypothetical protein
VYIKARGTLYFVANYSIFLKDLNKDEIEVVKVLDTTRPYTQRNNNFNDVEKAKQLLMENSTTYIIREEE